jgi:hypothetical protein
MQVSGKKFLLGLVSWLFFSFFCNAQDIQTTPNLIQNNWANTVTGNYNPGGTSGGNRAAYNPATQTILFGYTQQIVSQEIKLREVLQGTHLRLHGYNYSFQYMNSDFNRGFVSFAVDLKDEFGFSKQKDNYSLNQTNGWETVSSKRSYSSPFNLQSVDRFEVSFSGKDDRYWAGYYGPQIRNVSLNAMYVVDECAVNPLYATTCPNYQQAYFQSQCSINSLYSPSCAGYAQAYQNQQCSMNPLYSPACSGYNQAYQNQQCSLSPLFSSSCVGYAEALFTKTCNENPLSDTKCPLYEQAYLNQQCTTNPLFSTACPLYQQAFFNQQCTVNPLYNSGCPGYADAFRKKQIADACSANPQSNPQCPGYTVTQQITTVSTTTSLPVPSVGNEDVAKLLTTPQVTSDPIVNQALSSNQQSTQTNQQTNRNVSPQPQSSQRSQIREQQRRAGDQQRSQQSSQRNSQQDPQDAVMASLSTVPGFSAYEQAKLPDMPFYKAEDIYKRATIADNARALRQLNQRSDRIHKEMVDEQYRR